MDMREIFGKALGIDKPWFIADVNFDVKAKRLDIKMGADLLERRKHRISY